MLPKVAADFITKHSTNVKINIENVKKLSSDLVEEFNRGAYNLKTWKMHDLNPKSMDLDAISWIFFIDTINFSFWPEENEAKFIVEYKGALHTGYWSICAAVNKCFDNNIKVFDSSFMRDITVEQFNNIFKSINDGNLPLIDKRVEVINEAGRVLIDRFGGHFVNCIKEANNSAQRLLQIIVNNFQSYKDEAVYKDQRVCIYKRTQILIADIWCCFEGQGYGQFNDINTLTAFADYRVPQVLAYFGAIEYSQELKDVLENKTRLINGEEKEVEIRGVTLQCIEMMVKLIQSQVKDQSCIVNSILVDNYLWDYRRKKEAAIDSVAMHRTRTIYY